MKRPSLRAPGLVLLAAAAGPAAGAAPADGAAVYAGTCQRCHGTGEYGAPRLGDRVAWQPRFQRGMDDLMDHTVDGLRAMPPRGGNDDLTDAQLRAAIVHMLRAAGLEAD
jgi:cytochrome c5